MEQIGKLILFAGGILVLIGLAMWALGKAGLRGLPGDIRYEGDNVRFYFPIVTCLVLSAVLTLLLWLWSWIRRG